LPIFLYGCEMWIRTEGQLEVTDCSCFRRIAGVKLADRYRLENVREQCGTSSLKLIVGRRTHQWVGYILRMDEDGLPR